jgi:uncharacterized protein (DUF305 family)
MAHVVLPKTDDAELRELAENTVTAQKREIEDMRAVRKEHYGRSAPEPGHEKGADRDDHAS